MDTFKLVNLVKSDESILSQDTDLSICLKADGFFFTLIDRNYILRAVGEFDVDLSLGMTSVMTNIRNCFGSIGIRIFNFANIKVICLTNKNIFVPYKLYDNSKTKDYLRGVANIVSSDTIIENISEKLDAVSVFAFPMHQYSATKILMSKAKFYSQHQAMAEYCFDISKLANNTVVLHKRENACDMVVFKGAKFTYSNSFDFNNEHDMIYQILFAFEKLDIDVEDVNFLITGIEYTHEEKKVLNRHIKSVLYTNPMELIKVGCEFDGVSMQKYFLTLVK